MARATLSKATMRPWALCASVALLAHAGSVAFAEEAGAPTTLSCRFDAGHTWTLENGAFTEAKPSPLAFSIAAINLEKQSAQLILDDGKTGTLRVVRALNANSFLEVAQEGFLNLTTVYDKDATSGTYPAVHSRHFGLLGQPMFAQYAGTCTAK